jgi:hypothetical protein
MIYTRTRDVVQTGANCEEISLTKQSEIARKGLKHLQGLTSAPLIRRTMCSNALCWHLAVHESEMDPD